MSKRFWLILIAVALILGGIYFNQSKKDKTSVAKSSGSQHIEGQGKSGITLIEYGDYQCPFCGEFAPTLKQIATIFNQQITFQFKNLPLTQIHQNALEAARAAEAASLQNKFWEMHDALYATQSQWEKLSDPTAAFTEIAKQIGLNTTKFKTDLESSAVNDTINADVNDFLKTGFDEATPTFILDGKQIQPNNTVAGFTTYIQNEINKKQGKSTTATPSSSTDKNQSVQPTKK